jgi:hypothetical protein
MKKFLKYFGIYLIIMLIMTSIALEIDFEIITYLLTYGAIGLGLFFFLKYFNFSSLKSSIVLVIILTSIFPTYILTASIIMYETNLAYSKINSIPKEKLKEFYKTKNIKSIPEDKRRAWIGIFYREINIVSKNRVRKIKAVGWKGTSVFAYYDLDKDDYAGSYH